MIIYYWLRALPEFSYSDLSLITYGLFDGSFIWKRKAGAVILSDATENKLIRGEYNFKENSLSALLDLLHQLKSAGLSPRSCTVNGQRAVLAAVWPDIIIQR